MFTIFSILDNYIKKPLVAITLTMSFFTSNLSAALSPGDIAFVELNADNTETIAFVALVDIQAGEEIFFTDDAWNGNSFFYMEGMIKWTATNTVSAGTVVRLSDTPVAWDTASTGTVISHWGSLSLSSGGEQVIALQSGNNFIAAMNYDDSNTWAIGYNGSTASSNLPASLTNGTNVLELTPAHFDNNMYLGITTGDKATLLAAINNPANWVGDNSVLQTFSGSFTVASANSAPVLSDQSPALTTIDEDSTTQGTTVSSIVVDGSITDSDGAVEAIAVIAVDNTNGVWQYTTDGSSWTNFSGTTGSSVNIESSARLLDGTNSNHKIRFVPTGNYSGTATITFRAWDKSTGSAGSTEDASSNGGSTAYSSVSDTASIIITAINDKPTVSNLSGSSINWEEDTDTIAKVIDSDITISDPDSNDFNGGNLTVRFLANGVNDEDILGFDTSGSVSLSNNTVSVDGNTVGTIQNGAGTNGANLVLTFTTSDANASSIEKVIEAITYQNTDGDNPTQSTRTIGFTLDDGDVGGSTTDYNTTVVVTNVNDLPSLGGVIADINITEDITTAVDLSDYNVSEVESATVTITIGVNRGKIASIDGNTTTAGVTIANSGTTSMTLQGSIGDLNTYLNNTSKITFTTDKDDTSSATLTVTPNDGTANGTSDSITINILAVNDTPTITSTPVTSIDEDATYSYTLKATDIENDEINWSIIVKPDWLDLISNGEISFDSKFGSSGSNDGQLNSPFGIAVDASGNIYVGDTYNHRIQKFNSNGEHQLSFGSSGSSDGQVNLPHGVAVDTDGNIYVADTYNHRIQKFNSNGEHQLSFGSSGSSDGQFNRPHGVAVDTDGNIYVTDTNNNRIQKFNNNGEHQLSFGSYGSSDGQFISPYGITVDTNGNIYVPDSANNRIQKFNSNGEHELSFGSFGNGDGEFQVPVSVSVDKMGNIFVSDFINNRIQKFNSLGAFQQKFGTAGNLDGQFASPCGVSVDISNNIYVCERGNNRIQKLTQGSSLEGIPTNDHVGTHDVNLTLSDGENNVSHNFTITVNNVNDIPTSADINITIDEDNNKTFALSDFNFTDIDSGDALESIFITTLETNGSLTLNGADVTLNQEINSSAISNLVFTPASEASGIPYATFGFKVNDGDANSSSAYTATINVNNVNDAPIITAISEQNITEDSGSKTIAVDSSDAEGTQLTITTHIANSTLATVSYTSEIEQIGSDLNGKEQGDWSAYSVSTNRDGSIVVIGAPHYDNSGSNNVGLVQIFQNNNGTWEQIGSDILGETSPDNSGYSVSISKDGTTVAIGGLYHDSSRGVVRVYKNNNGTWEKIGADIDGENTSDQSGVGVAINADGTVVVIGANGNSDTFSYAGQVRVYKNNNGTWEQVGQDLNGEGTHEYFGYSVDISDDGSIIAAGAWNNDNASGNDAGKVRAFINNNGTWQQIGSDLIGEAAYDQSGKSVSLNADGSILAIGATSNDDGGSGAGHVRIYKNNNGTWNQIGSDIDGSENYSLGEAVSLSDDGNTVAIGTYIHTMNFPNGTGITKIYKNNNGTWEQLQNDIEGKNSGELSGKSLSLSGDGKVIAIGAYGYDQARGTTRVYSLASGVKVTPKDNATGTTTVTVSASDGVNETNTTFTLNITNVNDAPTSADINVTIDEDNNKTFALNDFNFTDIDTGASLYSIYITSLESDGNLTLNGSEVSLNQKIDSSDISSLVFSPDVNENGTPYTTFGFKVNDGDDNSSSAYTATINVNAINDTPTINSRAVTSVDEAVEYSYSLVGLDNDGDSLTWSVTEGTRLPNWLNISSTTREWSSVGSAGFSTSSADYTQVIFDSNNTPYVLFMDGKNDSYTATVMKYIDSNNSWVTVGESGFSQYEIDYPSIAIDSNDVLYVAYNDSNAGNGKATVKKFNGTSWETVGSAGFSAGIAHYTNIAIDGNNIPYVVYKDEGTSNKATVMKYVNGSWSVVGNAGLSTGTVDYTTIAFNSSNIPYVVYKDSSNNTKATVMKFDSGTWSVVGNAGFSSGVVDYTVIAFDNSDDPYVVYKDYGNSQKATVMKFDSGTWSNVGTVGFSAGTVTYTDIVFDNNDNPYVVYMDSANSFKATVMKYNGSSWNGVGTIGFGSGTTSYTSIAIDNNGIPYVSFRDGGNSNKATLMKLEYPQLVGTPSKTDSGTYDINLTVTDGEANVTQNFTLIVNNVNAAPTSADINVTIDEDNNKTFVLSDFNFTDVDAGDSLESIYITTLESDGNLTLNGSEVSLNQKINSSDISKLIFTPSANENGTPYTTFGFKVNDGDDNSSSAYTATINVTVVDDSPTLLSSILGDGMALDSSFSNDGKIVIEESSSFEKVAKLSDGKIIVSGKISNDNIVERYNSDGTIDTSFGTNGRITFNFDGSGAYISEMKIQDDGKIVLVGRLQTGWPYYWAMARLNSDGSLDTTFNTTGTSKRITSGGSFDGASAIEILSDGKYLVSSEYGDGGGNEFLIGKFENNGSLDTTFGINGIFKDSLHKGFLYDITTLDDGSIIGVGGQDEFYVIKVTPNGELNTTFGTNGRTKVDFTTSNTKNASEVMIQDDGKIVAVGGREGTGLITRLNSDGSLDTSFGTNGINEITYNNYVRFYSMKIKSNGKIVVVGDTFDSGENKYNLLIAQFNSDGSLDTTFDDDGIFTQRVTDSRDMFNGAHIDENGEIIIVGYTFMSTNNRYIIKLDQEKTISQITNPSDKLEDFETFSINLTYNDPENDSVSYSVDVNDSAIIEANITDSVLYISSVENKFGSVSLDINIRQNNDSSKNDSKTITFNVISVNDAPTSADINITIDEDNNKTFVLNDFNFADIDDGASLHSMYITTLETDGNLTFNGNEVTINQNIPSSDINKLVFIPDANEYGTSYATFGFKVNDGDDNSSIEYNVTINVTAVNDVPEFSGDFSVNHREDNSSNLSGVISIDDNDKNEAKFQIISNQNGSYGKFSLDENGSYSYELNSSIDAVQELRLGDSLTDSFNIISSDGNVTQQFTITIDGKNDIPTLDTNLSNTTIVEDSGTYTFEINTTDIEGSELNITVESNNTNILSVSKSWDGLLNQGGYDGIPLEFNLSTVQDANGDVKITIKVNDGDDINTSSFDINVTNQNDAPVIETKQDCNGTAVTAYGYPAAVSQCVFGTYYLAMQVHFIDNDMRMSLTPNASNSYWNPAMPAIGSEQLTDLGGNYSNLTFVADSCQESIPTGSNVSQLDFSPNTTYCIYAQTSTDGIFTLEATTGATVNDSFTNVSAQYNAPVLNSISQDELYNYTLSGSDKDKDDLNWSVSNNGSFPSWLTLTKNGTSAQLQGTPKYSDIGVFDVNLTLSDGNGGIVTKDFQITVKNKNDAPTLNHKFTNLIMGEDNGTTSYQFNVGDLDQTDLNVTIESNNTNIVKVSKAWEESLSFNEYNNIALDFNLTTLDDAYGNVRITVKVDDGEDINTTSFDINISGTDDAPILQGFNDINQSEDGAGLILDINLSDLDSNVSEAIFTVSTTDSSIANVKLVNGKLIVIPIENAYGTTTIELNATLDGKSVSKNFIYSLDSVNDSPTISEISDISFASDIVNQTYFNSLTLWDDVNVTSLNATISKTSNDDLISSLGSTIVSSTEGNVSLIIDANQTGVATITLTAQDGDGASYKESFTITVKASSDAICVDDTKNALSFDDIKGNNIEANYITSNLNLVSNLPKICNTNITWKSSDTSGTPAINDSGVVDTTLASKQTITLKATIVRNDNKAYKSFLLTVPTATLTDQDALDNISFETIRLKNSRKDKILSRLDLVSASLGKSVAWSSSNTVVVNPFTGYVTRDRNTITTDTNVTITATIGNVSKEFYLKVIALPVSDSEKATKDKYWLTYEMLLDTNKDNDNIISNLTKPLPNIGPDGSTISWSSSNENVITSSGDTIRDESDDKYVKLTATMTNGASTQTRVFKFKVLKNEVDSEDTITFKKVEDKNNTISVVFDNNGTELNTSVNLDTTLASKTERVISEDSVKSTIELDDRKLNLYLNTDGTTQSQTEILDENNNSVISAVIVDIPESTSTIDENGTVQTQIPFDINTTIKTELKPDGSVEHIVEGKENNTTTRATAKIPGSKIVAKPTGDVETISSVVSGNFVIEAIATSDKEGRTSTKIVKVNLVTGEETELEKTLDDSTPYPPDNNVTIQEKNGIVEIITITPVNESIRFGR